MIHAFKKHIGEQLSFLQEEKLLIAISGGLDSVVLGHLCVALKLNVAFAHCNFNLRGKESDEDQEFVKDFAKQMNVEVYFKNFKTKVFAKENKLSIQMAARDMRYAWFYELKDKQCFTYILTAHHADDSLETFLINLSRGTGIEGLSGIPEINGAIVRPLLPFSREQLLQYATEHKLKWREDSSNTETKYLRNKLRHELIPKLKELNPKFLENFTKTTNYIRGGNQLIDKHIKEYKQVFFNKEDGVYRIPVNHLSNLEPKAAYLYGFFKDFGFTDVTDLANLLTAQSGKQLYSHTHRVLKDRDSIFIQKISDRAKDESFQIKEDDTTLKTPFNMKLETTKKSQEQAPNIAYIDMQKLKFPLTVRKWKNGDYFYPIGLQGKKKLNKFFTDEKYSLIAKEKQWLLCSGGEIVWVIGKRLDDRFKQTEATKNILKITLL